jgi:hypothetical protein
MIIPIDQLYNFLDDIINLDSVIIYRFFPHGSKNINDLLPIKTVTSPTLANIEVFCCDQEPLDFYLYHQALPKTIFPERDTHPDISQLHYPYAQGLRSAGHTDGLSLNDHSLLVHSEKNSQDLELYRQDRYIDIYYWCHAVISRDWFRYAEIDPRLQPKASWPANDFLIYNRAWTNTREYRLKFCQQLVNQDLVKHCNIKFNPVDQDIHYTNYEFKNNKFKPDITDLENYFELNTYASSSSADYVSYDYSTSAIEVVLETLFDDSRWHLTEKILRPIACGQPWILAATAGSLKYLQEYGFKTFSPYINENYDSIQDPLDRLQAIVDELKRISLLPLDQKNDLLSKLQTIADYNKKRFFSQEFFDLVIGEFKQNLRTALDTLSPLRKGQNWKQYKKQMYHDYPAAYQELHTTVPFLSRQHLVDFHKWVQNPPEI